MQMCGGEKCMPEFIFNGEQIWRRDKRDKLMAFQTHCWLELQRNGPVFLRMNYFNNNLATWEKLLIHPINISM